MSRGSLFKVYMKEKCKGVLAFSYKYVEISEEKFHAKEGNSKRKKELHMLYLDKRARALDEQLEYFYSL